MKRLLNVGGSSKKIPIPPRYDGWQHELLDIDARFGVDVVMDARELHKLAAATYDAVYCSHTLEHFTRDDGAKVLGGFLHVLKPDGFAEIRVPDVAAIIRFAVARNADMDDVLYSAGGFEVSLHHALYGHADEVARSGHDYWQHKTGFTDKSMRRILHAAGFAGVATAGGNAANNDFDLVAWGFKQPQPSAEQIQMLRSIA